VRILALALVVTLSMSACSPQKPGDVPEMKVGRDACARCGMIVSDDRFASGYVDDDGRAVIYDDIGEFLEAVASKPELKARAFVRDAVDARWLPASSAVFKRIEGLPTPMGSGYAAFADEQEAAAFSTSARQQAR
jgi:copper chaperone NosL